MFAIKMGVAVGGFLQLQLLAAFGYQANVAQTPQALQGIKMLFSVLPAGFLLLCGVTMLFYPISESLLVRIEQDLKAREGQ